jgi:diguanylate cyclase (GGDEF)-like protein
VTVHDHPRQRQAAPRFWGVQRSRTAIMPAIIVGLILLIGLITVADFLTDKYNDGRSDRYAEQLTQGQQFGDALIQGGFGVRGYVLTGRAEELLPYQLALRALDDLAPTVLPKLPTQAGLASGSHVSASAALSQLLDAWSAAIHLEDVKQRDQAASALFSPSVQAARNQLQRQVASYVARAHEIADGWSETAAAITRAYQLINLVAVALAALAMIYAFGRIIRAINTGFAAREQTEQLFSMADMLQSAAGQEDTNEVLRATATRLLPGLGGALYVFNNSRDRLDLATRWGGSSEASAGHLAPNACWALKRGKPHMNRAENGALRCSHVNERQVSLEIPMAARGELYGLLEISADPSLADGPARLLAAQPVAAAMADAMSLALSSLALRERLRNQALRDALTGLYNRRFLEEMLERMCLEAERRKAPISAIMIDLDHFKRLNDQHGHSAGDAVLRDAASAILSCLRGTDVACRYGGEELAVLLPDCPLALAAGKAEQIRGRIAELTQAGGLAVTASLGVACVPETCGSANELLASADVALYRAKQLGRDRVEVASLRAPPPRLSLIETEGMVT